MLLARRMCGRRSVARAPPRAPSDVLPARRIMVTGLYSAITVMHRRNQRVQFGDDLVCGSGPGEDCGSVAMSGNVAADGGLQVGERAEHFGAQAAGQGREESLHRVQPSIGARSIRCCGPKACQGARGRREVEGPARAPARPSTNLGMFLGGMVCIPTDSAIVRPVQCVASPGGSRQVITSTRGTASSPEGILPGLRVLWRKSPSMPASRKRRCQRQTAGRSTSAPFAIAATVSHPAAPRMILARVTCF